MSGVVDLSWNAPSNKWAGRARGGYVESFNLDNSRASPIDVQLNVNEMTTFCLV